MVRQSAHVEMRGISLTSKSGIVEKLGTSFSTTRRVISRRETATFLHDYSSKIELNCCKKRNSRANRAESRPPDLHIPPVLLRFLNENRRKMLSPIYARELCGIALIHFGRQQKSGQWTEKLSVGIALTFDFSAHCPPLTCHRPLLYHNILCCFSKKLHNIWDFGLTSTPGCSIIIPGVRREGMSPSRNPPATASDPEKS